MEEIMNEEVELITDEKYIEEISEKIFATVNKKDELAILSEINKKEYKNIDLTLCVNTSNNNTILITLVYKNLTRSAKKFVEILKNLNKSAAELLEYINKKNNKGYNALLYSAFRGNLEIFDTLMELGADATIANSSGLNSLHLASQGDYPNIIVYLIEKYGLDVNSKDHKGNTALHWAVYMNSKHAVDYLIYYNIDINSKDNDGETAYGIAKNKGNQFLIKKFNEDFSVLIHNRLEESKENQGGENENEFSNNNHQNINFFNNKNLNEFLNKFLKGNSRNMEAYIFLLIIFVLEGLNQIIIVKGYNNLFMSLVFFILFILLLFFYFITSKSDPGEISNKYINSLVLLAEQGENLKNICPWCINTVNENTYHCFFCNKCINYQEFHDSYLNNCIGRNNLNLYVNFLSYIFITFVFKFVISFWGLIWLSGDHFKKIVKLIIPQILGVCAMLYYIIIKIKSKMKNINIYSCLQHLFKTDTKLLSKDNSTASTISSLNNKIDMNIQLSNLDNSEREII